MDYITLVFSVVSALLGALVGYLLFAEHERRKEKEKKKACLRALYIEIMAALRPLEKLKWEPYTVVSIPPFPLDVWSYIRSNGIIEPSDNLFISIQRLYENFTLMREYSNLAVQAFLQSASDRVSNEKKMRIVNGLMHILKELHKSTLALGKKVCEELARRAELSEDEITKIKSELDKRLKVD